MIGVRIISFDVPNCETQTAGIPIGAQLVGIHGFNVQNFDYDACISILKNANVPCNLEFTWVPNTASTLTEKTTEESKRMKKK